MFYVGRPDYDVKMVTFITKITKGEQMNEEEQIRNMMGKIRARRINCSGWFNVNPEEANRLVEDE